jgi:hypothetical protein
MMIRQQMTSGGTVFGIVGFSPSRVKNMFSHKLPALVSPGSWQEGSQKGLQTSLHYTQAQLCKTLF